MAPPKSALMAVKQCTKRRNQLNILVFLFHSAANLFVWMKLSMIAETSQQQLAKSITTTTKKENTTTEGCGVLLSIALEKRTWAWK